MNNSYLWLNDKTVLLSHNKIMCFLGHTSTVLFNPELLTVAKTNTNTMALFTYYSVPRSYTAIIKRFLGDDPNSEKKKSLRNCIMSLVDAGILVTEGKLPEKKVSWECVSWYPDAPITVAIHVTYQCNLSCDYCYNSNCRTLSNENELDRLQWEKVITELCKCGVKKLDITGGEPLLRKDLFPVFRKALDNGIEVILITNGTLINNSQIARQISSSFSRVVLSLDSYNSDEHNKHRGEGSHEKTVQAAKYLTEQNVTWTAKMVFNYDTCNSFEKTHQYALSLGARGFGGSMDVVSCIDEDKRKEVFLAIELNSVRNPNMISMECDKEEMHKKTPKRSRPFGQIRACAVARTECALDPAGNIFPCRVLIHPDFNGGNVLESGFKDLWNNSPSLQKLRNFDYSSLSQCRDCEFFNLCLGGCRGLAFMRTGKINGFIGDDMCRYNKIMRTNQILEEVGER